MLVSTVLCVLLWKRYSARLLSALRAHRATRQAPLQGLHSKLVRAGLRARLRRLEGGYRLQLDDQGFTLIHDRGARERLEWTQIARLQATPDFYKVACARLAAEGKAYHIPRHSDAMDPAAYRQGLALWLSKCPVALETPAAMEP